MTRRAPNAAVVDDLCERLRGACLAAGHGDQWWSPGYLDQRVQMVDWEHFRVATEAQGLVSTLTPPPFDCVRTVLPGDSEASRLATDLGAPGWIWTARRSGWLRHELDRRLRRVFVLEVGTCHVTPGGLAKGVAYEVTVPLTAVDRALARLAGVRAEVNHS